MSASTTNTAVFGGGCFWCTEAVFQQIRGVAKVESGYSGGDVANPTYGAVCGGNTGHAEVIRVTYDTAVISYKELLTVFFASHDPTTLNRQGNDVGEQYRSIIFYANPEEKKIAEEEITSIQASICDGSRVVTQIEPVHVFYTAESNHQNYYNVNKTERYCQIIIEPKVEKIRKAFAKLVKKETVI